MNEKWFDHIKVEVDHADCYKFKEWEPYDSKEICIVDVGGNVGAFSLLASEKYPQANIHCFEFIEENFKFLSEKLKETNVICYNKAMVGSNKPVGFFYHTRNHGGHKPIFGEETLTYLNEKRFSSYWNRTEIDSISFTDFVNDNDISKIDFLKLDCEGSEYEIFKNINENNLWNKILNISFEIHGPKSDQKVLLDCLRKYYKNVSGKKIIHCRDLYEKYR